MPDANFPITIQYDDTDWTGIILGYVLLEVLGTPTWVDLSRVYLARTSPPTWRDVWEITVSDYAGIVSAFQCWKKVI